MVKNTMFILIYNNIYGSFDFQYALLVTFFSLIVHSTPHSLSPTLVVHSAVGLPGSNSKSA
jgi:hypothetical protein